MYADLSQAACYFVVGLPTGERDNQPSIERFEISIDGINLRAKILP
jgi:hypothetical protein